MLVTPWRSLRVEKPAKQTHIHRKERVRAQAERKSHTSCHQSFQSKRGLLSRQAGMFGELGADEKR